MINFSLVLMIKCFLSKGIQIWFLQQIKINTKSEKMPSNVCGLTGQLIKEGAVSKKTGHVYEKSAITKHLSSFPYCPITNQAMSLDDLVFVQANKQPIQKPDESVGTILNTLKQQYDTLVLERFYLKKSIKEAKEQLAHSLTGNQASEKVIGKLIKEKQALEKEIGKLKTQLSV